MRNFNLRSDRFVFSVTIMILFASTIWISSVRALLQQQTSLSVRITDPVKGQQVGIGKNLTLSGTSSYNATSKCGVFVIVDGIKPYQKTIPIGQAGGNDYSKWKYTLNSTYAGTLREGVNRITAKLVCQANPANLTKFYSINVTGTSNVPPNNTTTNSTGSPSASSDSSGGAGSGHHHSVYAFTSSSSASSYSSGHHHHHHHVGSIDHSGGPGGGYDEGPGGGYDEGPGGGYDEGPGG